MPASLPGETLANNLGNPALGAFVMFDPLSGPKGAPLDKDNSATTGHCSTGALCTGIGFGCGGSPINIQTSDNPQTAPGAIYRAGFNDNYEPGKAPTYSAAPPNGVVASSAITSTRMYIGGGRMAANGTSPDKYSVPWIVSPYTAGIALCGAGNGASRDGGANTGFPTKIVTAAGAVATGAVIETGFNNRSGIALVANQSVLGSGTTALAAAA
jgi:hypothetical protein